MYLVSLQDNVGSSWETCCHYRNPKAYAIRLRNCASLWWPACFVSAADICCYCCCGQNRVLYRFEAVYRFEAALVTTAVRLGVRITNFGRRFARIVTFLWRARRDVTASRPPPTRLSG